MLVVKRHWKIPMILAGFTFYVSLGVLIMRPSDLSYLISYLSALPFMFLYVIIAGVIAFYVGNDSFLPSVGLFAFGLALPMSFLSFLDITMDGWRLADSISYDLNSRAGLVEYLFLMNVLPLAASLALVLIAFALNRRDLTKAFKSLPLLLIGILITLWGLFSYNDGYSRYVKAPLDVQGPNATQALTRLQEILLVYELIGVVWAVSGALIVVISLCVLRQLRRFRTKVK